MSDIGRYERRLVGRSTRRPAVDSIEISGLTVFAHHGVHEAERADGQPFVVDVVLETDTQIPGRTDDLADAIDYAALVDRIAGLVRSTRFNLLEALAVRIAEDLLTVERVSAVGVRVHKPQVELAEQVAEVAVHVVRSRPVHLT